MDSLFFIFRFLSTLTFFNICLVFFSLSSHSSSVPLTFHSNWPTYRQQFHGNVSLFVCVFIFRLNKLLSSIRLICGNMVCVFVFMCTVTIPSDDGRSSSFNCVFNCCRFVLSRFEEAERSDRIYLADIYEHCSFKWFLLLFYRSIRAVCLLLRSVRWRIFISSVSSFFWIQSFTSKWKCHLRFLSFSSDPLAKKRDENDELSCTKY